VKLRCPACGESIAREGRLVCTSCGAGFSEVDGVPLLVPPALSLQHEHQREYFDAEFKEFEEYRVDDWRRSFNDRIFPALRLSPERSPYLDIGVGGSGATVIEAARAGIDAVGCDLSVEGVVRAARFARSESVDGHASFVVCAAEALPFPDESFGAASAVALFEHLDDDRVAAREVARVLRPGARLWVTVPHAYKHMPPFAWPMYWWHDRRIGHKRHYGEDGLRALFEPEGFAHVETQYTGHPVKLAQYAALLVAEQAGRDVSSLWWKLERADLRALRRRFWALQISTVFEKR
jgi:ubiquinone/menaquinone biosynthesis C-methylase UbiE